jgi:hypothetical protein
MGCGQRGAHLNPFGEEPKDDLYTAVLYMARMINGMMMGLIVAALMVGVASDWMI